MAPYDLFRAGCWHELVYDDGVITKWWDIKIHKDTHIRKWGGLASAGRTKTTEFDTAELARVDAQRRFNAQLKQGYRIKKPHMDVDTKLTHIVTSAELERFFISVYGMVDWSYEADRHDNDIYDLFDVDGYVSEFSKEDIKVLVEGNKVEYMTGVLLNDCARQKLIPTGAYLVSEGL